MATTCATWRSRSGANCCEQVVTPGPALRISDAFPGAGEELLEAARENGLEGIIAKHANSGYESRRSREWLKIKIVSEQEFVIGGFTEPQGDRDYFGALVLGVHKDGKLRWVGNVGTGFDQKLLASIFARLEPLITKKCPFAERPKPDRGMTWVKPELVCQVKLRQLDHGRPPARARLPRPAQRQGGRHVERGSARGRLEPAGQLLPASAKEATLTIDGHALKFTNLQEALLPRRRRHQARCAQLLRRRRRPDPAPPEGPSALAQALSQRHQGAVLLPEGHAGDLSRLAAHGADRSDHAAASATCSPRTAPACCIWSTWAASITIRG